MPSEGVRDQSPISLHNRHDRPNASQARLAATPAPDSRRNARSTAARDADTVRPAPTPAASDSENVDIDALREFDRIGRRLERRERLQIVRLGLWLALEHVAGPETMR